MLATYGSRGARITDEFANSAQSIAASMPDGSTQLTASQVEQIRERTLQGQLDYQQALPYAPGPDLDLLVDGNINPFPVNESAVDALSERNDPTLPQEPNFDRGLPALDYILFQDSTAENTAARLRNNPGELALLRALVDDLQLQARSLSNAWEDAEVSLPQRVGSGAGSGLSTVVNLVSKHFEDLRRDKLGTPLGVSTLNIPNPQTTEAPYSRRSIALLRAGIESSRRFMRNDGNGPALQDYLLALANPEAKELVQDLLDQYDLVMQALQAVEESLAKAVVDDRDDAQELYNRLSRQVVNLKTDVPAVACVAITYVDNPSDSD